MLSRLFSTIFCFLVSLPVYCQGFQTVFPGLDGNDLIDSISLNYRPSVVLDYANARDTLYARILSVEDDSLRCIYSGHTLYLDPTSDPTQYIFQNGGTNGMNTEHGYPVGKGATQGTNAYSDMHHLFPTRIAVNDARADKPLLEVPDGQTQKWFINNLVQTNIPTSNIALYAESGSNAFEPREASKGDLARAVFYFYTVYRNQANAADPNFFESQRSTLCLWNAQDPADAAELAKTWRIGAYQENKPNPFILDCTLAYRSWCPEVSPVCLSGVSQAQNRQLNARIYPQPAGSLAYLQLNLSESGFVRCRVLTSTGQELTTLEAPAATEGQLTIPLELSELLNSNCQLCFVEITFTGLSVTARKVMPLVLTH